MSIEKNSTTSVPIRQRYTYLALRFQHFILCCGILVGVALIGVSLYIRDKGGLSGIPIAIFFTWFMFMAEKSFFERNRPLEIDENGVSAMAFGRAWKSIPWSEVQHIERIRTRIYLSLGSRYGYEFVIVGAHDSIKLDDTICKKLDATSPIFKLPIYDRYPAILITLNFYIQRYNISLVAYDRGEDTRDKIKATLMDKQERKKLLKKGVQTSISTL